MIGKGKEAVKTADAAENSGDKGNKEESKGEESNKEPKGKE